MVQFDCKGMIVTLQDKDAENTTVDLIADLLEVWESSVRATHLFLSEREIKDIRRFLPFALAELPHLIVAESEEGAPVAFAGVDGHKLEMLFVSAENRGKGIGKRLLQYAVARCGVRELAVNEQNPQAIGFYEHMGFLRYKRSDTDEQGNPYPVLYMKREKGDRSAIGGSGGNRNL